MFCPGPNDVIIALMGVTGVGKSTFISHCTNKPIAINSGLQSCTKIVSVYQCELGGRKNVYLVDTPGFDDTNRTDTEVLTEIADWLTETYKHNVKLNGIIYLHRITDLRMTGSARENVLRFQSLCGSGALKKVVLATTMWEVVDPSTGEKREGELKTAEDFWGYMIRHKSQIHRHYNNVESVRRLIGLFANGAAPVTLRLEEEMVDQGRSLIDTSVGRGWEEAFRKAREKYDKELEELRAAMDRALREKEDKMASELKELEKHLKYKLGKKEQETQALAPGLEKLKLDYSEQMETMTKEEIETRVLARVLERLKLNYSEQMETILKLKSREEKKESTLHRLTRSLEETAKGLNLRVRSLPGLNLANSEDICITIYELSLTLPETIRMFKTALWAGNYTKRQYTFSS